MQSILDVRHLSPMIDEILHLVEVVDFAGLESLGIMQHKAVVLRGVNLVFYITFTGIFVGCLQCSQLGPLNIISNY
jgi:hypothetical protein